jgi:hypothetical protein
MQIFCKRQGSTFRKPDAQASPEMGKGSECLSVMAAQLLIFSICPQIYKMVTKSGIY